MEILTKYLKKLIFVLNRKNVLFHILMSDTELKNARRNSVLQAYYSSVADNNLRFLEGDDKATSEYIFSNQKEDANNIVNIFYNSNVRVISIQKKTKVGADGLMIEVAKCLSVPL